MQTERVTFLTTPDHKAALDAFAASNGHSVGHVLREAASRYIAGPEPTDDDEEALELALPEIEAAIAHMSASIATMRDGVAKACAAVDAALVEDAR